MHSPFEENANSRTLYVGNLDPSVSEELLMALFKQMGPCKNCKIIHEPTSDPYAFIEFTEHQAAANALLAMNKRLVMGKEIKVNWATTSASGTMKVDTSKHFHIFVGDLAPEVDQNAIREAFSPFGEISEVKIAKFTDTQKPKGYCFVSFTNQSDAETAITSMNGQWLGTRKIRTNWATRKAPSNEPPTAGARTRDSNNPQYGQESLSPKLDFVEVWNRTSDTNSTVYFGNCGEVSEDLVRSFFEPYGQIVEIRVFKEKGYAFVRFATKENACQAICHLHGSDIHGYTVKCGWGRDESSGSGNNVSNYGSSMNNQNYNNNQYDSYSQNSYGPPSNNNYMGGSGGGHNANYGKYGGNYPQQQQQQQHQQQYYNPQQQWNNNGPQAWDSYPQSASSGWNNNNNNNFGPNANQYYGQQQSHMYSSNSGWGRSQR